MRTKPLNLFTNNYRFKTAIFLLIVMLIMVIISIVLLATANFSTRKVKYGNGFWALKQYSFITLLKSWYYLDYEAIKGINNQPIALESVIIALILLVIVAPIISLMIIYLLIRAWVKTRI